MKRDISTKDDIKLLVDQFYDHARTDDLLSPIFDAFIGDNWAAHLSIIYQFWEGILFGSTVYKGNPMLKHIHVNKTMPLTSEHFNRWIKLWKMNADDLFEGEKIEGLKLRAGMIKDLMIVKIRASERY